MILTFVEHEGESVNNASLEALTFTRQLAEKINEPLQAIVIGEISAPALQELGAYGVSHVHSAQDARLNEYAPAAYAQCIVETIRALHPNAVIAAGTERGSEILVHAAARTDLPMAANCIAVQPGDSYTVTRLRWGGSLYEEATLDAPIKLLTVAPNAIAAERAANPQNVSLDALTPQLAENDFRVRLISRAARGDGKISLGEARVVVGGGRGVGSAEGFRALEELAELLGGAVGASRAVTSLGWRAHADQIGQTGARIAPELYIACGVSGAIQHMIGCKAAKHLLAINTDPEAPIMAKADYVVVGDLQQVVPAISAEIKKRRG